MAIKNRLKNDNILKILETLWRNPHSSRADLARMLRLDRSTVGSLADWMIARRMITESSTTHSTPKGGRPPIQLSIKGGYAYAIGVELTIPFIRLYAGDLNGDLLGQKEIPVSNYGTQAIDSLAVELARFRKEIDQDYPMTVGLAAVGLGVSGAVDNDKKEIILSNALKINQALSVAEPLETVLNVPIILFNDAQAYALSEADALGKKNLILALIEKRSQTTIGNTGVGIGMVNNDMVINGRAITHLLQPSYDQELEKMEQFIQNLGRSLALIANVTSTNDIVLGGDVEKYRTDLEREILVHLNKEGDPLKTGLRIHRASPSHWAVAASSRHAALRHILHNRSFPLNKH
ncbi:ROK family transcriptional regulator [Oceanispirochaeta crateris]|uniref:ROK family transcriptional regulator n=1 Tax=Oceanispirochaeta crateris TaxID=2518645 RepID=A0A5C1QFX4_9SPIO|nr:ROK family transcriptional regulator [Oceanispirochaeta crateris]QEN06965.1 ROK family transcriptional regulator [Oceanispirochaeta crateris]